MGYSIPPDYGNLVLTLTSSAVGQPDTVRFGLQYIGVDTMVDADFNRIANLFRDGLKPLYDPTWNLGPVKQYYNASGLERLSEDPTLEPGTVSVQPYASDQVAYIVQKKTGFVGQAFRGRVYMPGVTEGSVDVAGNVAAGTITLWNTTLAALYASVNGDPNVSSLTLLHTTPTADLPTQILSLSLAPKVGTVRLRVRR